MHNVVPYLVIGLVVLVIFGIYWAYKNYNTIELSTDFKARPFLTMSEAALYRLLVQSMNGRLVVFPKIRLIDIILPVPDSAATINSMIDRYVDYALVESLSLRVIAVIELYDLGKEGDETPPDDDFMENALESAGIHVVMIPRKKHYLLADIKEILSSVLPGIHHTGESINITKEDDF